MYHKIGLVHDNQSYHTIWHHMICWAQMAQYTIWSSFCNQIHICCCRDSSHSIQMSCSFYPLAHNCCHSCHCYHHSFLQIPYWSFEAVVHVVHSYWQALLEVGNLLHYLRFKRVCSTKICPSLNQFFLTSAYVYCTFVSQKREGFSTNLKISVKRKPTLCYDP